MKYIKLFSKTPKENKPRLVRLAAKALGVTSIEDTFYILNKTKAKRPSELIPDKGYIERGYVSYVGFKDQVWILVSNTNTWFKTSPIVSCKPFKKGYKIETQNSLYELIKA